MRTPSVAVPGASGAGDVGGHARQVSALAGSSIALRLEALARSQAPLRRALARVAGRIVAVRSWERLGFARVGDYARERAGLSGRQLQDLAHVDGRLAALPVVERAFVAGALSWSKARLLARVAEADDEARWVAFARRVPVRVLEREVRAVDRGAVEAAALATDEEGSALHPMAGVVVRCAPPVQGKFHRARQVARRVAGEALPAWACMEAVAAEALGAMGGGSVEEAEEEPAEGHARDEGTAWSDRTAAHAWLDARAAEADVCAPEPVLAVRSLGDGLEAADAFELDARLRRATLLEQRIEAEMAPLLRRIADTRLHLRAGHASLAAFARDRLGISERKARALVRLARAAAGCPELRTAFGGGAISWVQAQALLPLVALPESAPFRAAWVAWAERVSVRRLEEDVDAALVRLASDPVGFAAGGGAPGEDAERQTCAERAEDRDPGSPSGARPAEEESARFFFAAPLDVARLFRAVACSVRRALERRVDRPVSEGEAVEWMFDHAFESWGANDPRVRREHLVFERDGWRCTVPGCSSYRNLHDHHVVFRSAGGSDELENRTTLCAFHHLRGVHAGRVRCTGSAPSGLRFDLGLREGRAPLVRYDARERILSVGQRSRSSYAIS